MRFNVYVDKEKFGGVTCFSVNATRYETIDDVVVFPNKDDQAEASFAAEYVYGIVRVADEQ